ncbi:PREDICTED: conserved oligomeric Golgi complex subunit 8 [Ceratosolen solmsi marchali]|uniref:Conserved oligomeric Golgi complex subunit 8 n=1 Tax=Ceratosolen solmsi marchali TaxID=326594 RepID=A0AAJ6YQJ0_9HYME|nr:PREDICTED: conserved oligomeric Golgi complex subunit 8 [Ceratosolen solmsi marchali]
MDIETEKIIELLFPCGIPESWKENSEFYQYLAKIGKYDIDELTKEPDRLTDKRIVIQQSIQDLISSNYITFVHNAQIFHEIFKEFNQTEDKLDDLLDKIPQFINQCKSFCNISEEVNIHRRLNNLILSKNAQLVEILELPQLMKSFLQNNEYSEALDISQYAKYINGKYGDIPVIVNVINDLESCWILMVKQVVTSLKDDLSLPKCLQLIGLLRSMDAFTDSELRIKFIQARDYWFQIFLNSISTKDTNAHLTRTIELSRIHLFNIVTQYKAIFNDYLTFDRGSTINDSAIFYQWLKEKVLLFLTTLEQDLPCVNSIDSILSQCTYFGLSFGRVGADFTGLIADIFIKIIDTKIKSNILKSTKKFEKNLENFTLAHTMQKSDIKSVPVIKSENPPEQLVEFYPLAEYCNDLIALFNELRLNVPIALVQSLTVFLQNSLRILAITMFSFYKNRDQILMPVDKQNMVQFFECLSEQLIPYIQFCIHALFPPNQVATYFGTSVSQLQKEEISYLNKKYIIEPIKSLLPIKNISVDTYLSNTFYSKDSLLIHKME